jgi:hypothetical protein
MRDANIPERLSSAAHGLPSGALARVLPEGLDNALAEIEALRKIWQQQPNPELGDRLADWLSAAVRAEYGEVYAASDRPTHV